MVELAAFAVDVAFYLTPGPARVSGLLTLSSPVPRWSSLGFWQRPQTALRSACLGLEVGQRRIGLILKVGPRQATANQLFVDVEFVDENTPDVPAVLIAVRHNDAYWFAKHQFGQALLGTVAKRLAHLWCVDFCQAYFGWCRTDQYRERVAIGDADNFAGDLFGAAFCCNE